MPKIYNLLSAKYNIRYLKIAGSYHMHDFQFESYIVFGELPEVETYPL